MGDLFITGRAEPDALLNRDGTALLIGMLLDQQVPMEWAFAGPWTLRQRLGTLDAGAVADLGEEAVVAAACAKPAIHRFPAVMGRRIHALCRTLATEFGGRGEEVWAGAADGEDLYRRLRLLPGFGEEKARILIAVLGKRMGVTVPGWRAAAGSFGDDQPRTVADSRDPASLARVRAWKQEARRAGRDKQDRPLTGGARPSP